MQLEKFVMSIWYLPGAGGGGGGEAPAVVLC
jgi:hypothetical protein